MRYQLTDHEWVAIKPMLPNKPRGVGNFLSPSLMRAGTGRPTPGGPAPGRVPLGGHPGAIAPTATTLRVQEISIFSMFTVTNIVLGAIFSQTHPAALQSLLAKTSSIDLNGKVAGFNSTLTGRF